MHFLCSIAILHEKYSGNIDSSCSETKMSQRVSILHLLIVTNFPQLTCYSNTILREKDKELTVLMINFKLNTFNYVLTFTL